MRKIQLVTMLAIATIGCRGTHPCADVTAYYVTSIPDYPTIYWPQPVHEPAYGPIPISDMGRPVPDMIGRHQTGDRLPHGTGYGSVRGSEVELGRVMKVDPSWLESTLKLAIGRLNIGVRRTWHDADKVFVVTNPTRSGEVNLSHEIIATIDDLNDQISFTVMTYNADQPTNPNVRALTTEAGNLADKLVETLSGRNS